MAMQYYDLKKNWRKVKRHLQDEDLNRILVWDFDKFSYGRKKKPFTRGRYPCEFDSSDWRLYYTGRRPAFWMYSCSLACHWLVNFNLKLAMLVEPKKQWRILTSDHHLTVWDGTRRCLTSPSRRRKSPRRNASIWRTRTEKN